MIVTKRPQDARSRCDLARDSGSIDQRAMTTTAIYASRILTPQDEISDGVIIVEGSQIAARRPSRRNPRALRRHGFRGDRARRLCRGLSTCIFTARAATT